MSSRVALSATKQSRVVRMTLATARLVALLAVAHGAAEAQASPTRAQGWDFLLSTGTVVPTGAQGDVVERGKIAMAQLSYALRPAVAVNLTLGWTRTRDIASLGEPKLDVFSYDIGPEIRAPRWTPAAKTALTPFAGFGVGARSYNYRSLDVDATHNVAAYGSAGGEMVFRRVSLRLEARDYVSGFQPLDGQGSARTHNDVVLIAGLRFVR